MARTNAPKNKTRSISCASFIFRAPMRRKIKRDQFLVRERFVIRMDERAIKRTDEIALNKIVNPTGAGGLNLCDGALFRQLILVKRIELSGLFSLEGAPFGFSGNLSPRTRDLFRRNGICSVLERGEEFRCHSGLD